VLVVGWGGSRAALTLGCMCWVVCVGLG
jgi:hypothetical protein